MIKTDEFIIRTVEESDLDYLHDLNTNEFRGEYQEFQFESKKSMRKQYDEDGFCSDKFQMLIAEKNGQIVGLVYISFVRLGLVNFGLVLCENHRAKKLGTRITLTIVDYLFKNYDVARIQADTDVNNIAAQRVLEKANFKKEGILKNYRFHHGRYNDSFLYAIIKC